MSETLFVLEPHRLPDGWLEVGDLVVTSHDGYLRLRSHLGGDSWIVHREGPQPPTEWKPIGPYTIRTLLPGESRERLEMSEKTIHEVMDHAHLKRRHAMALRKMGRYVEDGISPPDPVILLVLRTGEDLTDYWKEEK